MIVSRKISFGKILKWSGQTLLWLLIIMSGIAGLYYFDLVSINIPLLPVSVIGTAVAFFVGFKNNQAYDRMWEARKSWGGIVTNSRSWGMMVDTYISNFFQEDKISEQEIYKIKKRLIYRHIGWLYAHRSQLLVPTEWEHISQGGYVAKTAKMYQDKFGVGLFADETTTTGLGHFLPPKEHDKLIHNVNTATQIINQQSRDLQKLREQNIIEHFHHIEMVNILNNLHAFQGKNERIKKFPFPRMYAYMSRIFVGIFVLLFPFSMIPELMKVCNWGVWLSIPITTLIGGVYVMMELVGDYSENPFQGMANDIPMMSLCRTIEIDLREVLDETDLPPKVEAKNGILM